MTVILKFLLLYYIFKQNGKCSITYYFILSLGTSYLEHLWQMDTDT